MENKIDRVDGFMFADDPGTDEARAELEAQGKAEGREVLFKRAPSRNAQALAEGLAKMPHVPHGTQAFLDNLDAIAAGRVRPLTAAEAAEQRAKSVAG